MVTKSLSEFRKHLKESADEICDHHETLLVKRQNGPNLVVMSEADFLAIDETLYLLSNPTNANHLLAAVTEKGGTTFNSLADLKARNKPQK